MQGIKQNAQFRHNLLTLPPQTTGLFLTNEPGIIKGGFNGVELSSTKLLLHFENSGDASPGKHLLTAVGTPVISSEQSKFGGKSAEFDGGTTGYSIPNNGDFTFADKDFTIDWWEYRRTDTQYIGCAFDVPENTDFGFMVGTPYNNQIMAFASTASGQWDMMANFAIGDVLLNQWVHRALVRRGTTFYGFQNGMLYGTQLGKSGKIISGPTAYIGKRGATNSIDGFIDELRVSDVARWTSNFAPLSEPYTNENTNTKPTSYLVAWKPNGIPSLPSDGQSLAVAANGSANYSFTIPGLTNGASYGVRVFVRGKFGFQTSPEAQGTMTPMAGVQLGTKPVGSKIRISINGVAYNWLIVQIGRPSSMYDVSCDGVWLLLESIYSNRVWDASSLNDYAASDINIWLNGDFIALIEAAVRSQIKEVKIPYGVGNESSAVNSGANGLSVKAFLLGGYEMGWTKTDLSDFVVDGARLSHFESGTDTATNNKRVARLNGIDNDWHLRSPSAGTHYSWYVESYGTPQRRNPNGSRGIRPCVILPRTFMLKTAANSDGSFDPL